MSPDKKKRCVVLGGCGFLGSVISRHLVENGWKVRVFDQKGINTWRLETILNEIELVTGDFLNTSDLANAVRDMPTVLHFIGTTIPQSSMSDIQFDIETNIAATVRLLDIVRGNEGQRIIFASSGGTVYGMNHNQDPLLETDPTEPIVSYGVSKLTIEKFLQLFGHNFGVPYVILRIANPYGESQSVDQPQGAVGVFLNRSVSGQKIEIWGDGSVVRDYIYESDVASAVNAVLTTDKLSGIYNIGSGIGTSLNSLLDVIREVTGLPCEVVYHGSRKFDVPSNILNIGKIRRDFGWSPGIGLSEGIRQMVSVLSQVEVQVTPTRP
ncbi:MAG: NAD-dependent epimerase/dehydratase family protein [Pseudomonadales bacterium]